MPTDQGTQGSGLHGVAYCVGDQLGRELSECFPMLWKGCMKIADHFQELWSPSFEAPSGSVRDFLADSAYGDEQGITQYLLAGHDLFSIMGSSEDVLGSGQTVMGGDSIYSDGEWVWRGDLWFYVRTHHVTLPTEFLERIRNFAYVMPDEELSSLMEIAKEIRTRL